MLPVFVRRCAPGEEAVDEAVLPADLGEGEATLRAETLVARRREGPFLPFFQALREDPALRAIFARALQLPLLRRLRPWRTWLLAGLVPLLVVVELERELWSSHVAPVGARLVTDVFVCAYVAADLVRPVPRHPRACALLLFAVTARYLYMIAVARAHGLSAVMWGAPAVAFAAGLAVWILVPTRATLVERVLARFRLHAPKAEHGGVPRAIPRALAAALGVPTALLVTRALGGTLWVQAAVFLVVGGLAAWLARAPTKNDDYGPVWDIRSQLARLAEAVALGLAVTLGLAGLAHYLLNTGAQVLQATHPELYERTAARFLQSETVETSRQIAGVRSRYAFVLRKLSFVLQIACDITHKIFILNTHVMPADSFGLLKIFCIALVVHHDIRNVKLCDCSVHFHVFRACPHVINDRGTCSYCLSCDFSFVGIDRNRY